MKNDLDKMLEAKREYKRLRQLYLEKIEKIKEYYQYELGSRSIIVKKEIILGMA